MNSLYSSWFGELNGMWLGGWETQETQETLRWTEQWTNITLAKFKLFLRHNHCWPREWNYSIDISIILKFNSRWRKENLVSSAGWRWLWCCKFWIEWKGKTFNCALKNKLKTLYRMIRLDNDTDNQVPLKHKERWSKASNNDVMLKTPRVWLKVLLSKKKDRKNELYLITISWKLLSFAFRLIQFFCPFSKCSGK